jgi:hypothetical protein
VRKFVYPAFLIILTVVVEAQSAAMKPFELNMERVKVNRFGGNLAASNTILVPTVNLLVTSHGSVWSQKGGAQAHGKFYVEGLSKQLMQELAGKIQEDLVTQLRAAGKTVLTYADVKDEAAFTGRARLRADAKWGVPIRGGWGQPLTFLIGTPSDAQAFDNPIQGPVWWMQSMAKEKNLVVIVPEISLSVPQMFGQTESGYKRDKSGIATDPAMVLESAMVYTLDPKGVTNIQVQRHGKRFAAEVTGTIEKASEDKTDFSDSWKRTSADFVMTLDQTAFVDGVLRVGYAINKMIVSEIGKAKK